jgi:hypothetical protein
MPVMFLNPVDSSSSDMKSFDEVDMYRSGPDVKSFSLSSSSKANKHDANNHSVCQLFTVLI